MQVGLVGLGRIGGGIAERLKKNGIDVAGFDSEPMAVEQIVGFGCTGASTLKELVEKLNAPRVIWISVPQGAAVSETVKNLLPLLSPGDILVDGGNSNYKDSIRRHQEITAKGFQFVDVGISCGRFAVQEGYCLMVGGDKEPVEKLRPVLDALAADADKGWAHVGKSGSGHFAKMIHNGIEYGLMEAYAEGFALLAQKEEMGLSLMQISELWRHGSVINGYLVDMAARELGYNPLLEGVGAYVENSEEGRWAVDEAIELNVSAPVITTALLRRIRSREENNFTDRMLAILRNAFGGYEIRRS